MVYFVGAGTGAADLITVRGRRLLEQADVIIYAGSLVNPELLGYAGEECEIHNSAEMTLEEVLAVMQKAEAKRKTTVRLHTGEPSIYGAVREQMDALDRLGISYESCPGVSACFGAAASLNLEYTLPGISQSLIINTIHILQTRICNFLNIFRYLNSRYKHSVFHNCSYLIYRTKYRV